MQRNEEHLTALGTAKNTTVFVDLCFYKQDKSKTIITVGTTHGEELSIKHPKDLQQVGDYLDQNADDTFAIILEKPCLSAIKQDYYQSTDIHRTGRDYVQNDLAKRHETTLRQRGVIMLGTDGRKQYIHAEKIQTISLVLKSLGKDFRIDAQSILEMAQSDALIQIAEQLFDLFLEITNAPFSHAIDLMNSLIEYTDGTDMAHILHALHNRIAPLLQTLSVDNKRSLKNHFLDDIQEIIHTILEDEQHIASEAIAFQERLQEKARYVAEFEKTEMFRELIAAGCERSELLTQNLDLDIVDIQNLTSIKSTIRKFIRDHKNVFATKLIDQIIIRLGDLPLLLEIINSKQDVIVVAYGSNHVNFLNSYLRRVAHSLADELAEDTPLPSVAQLGMFAKMDPAVVIPTLSPQRTFIS